MKELYYKRLNDLIKGCSSDKKTYFFFKGFSADFFRILRTIPDADCTQDCFIQSNGYIDIEKLCANKSKALISIISGNGSISLRFYEELSLISSITGSIKAELDGNIVVVDNNLFNGFYPAYFENGLLNSLTQIYNIEEYCNDETFIMYSKYYSSFTQFSANQYTLTFLNTHRDEQIKEIPFYIKKDVNISNSNLKADILIQVQDDSFLTYKIDLEKGIEYLPTTFIIDFENDKFQLDPIIAILDFYKIKYSIKPRSKFEFAKEANHDCYLKILRQYWGSNANFRKMSFYENPDLSNSIIDISQGDVISNIIEQCKISLKRFSGNKNFFITSPTGSGKSLLFQLPAIYLAEEYSAVTIVISPLKALMVDQVTQLNDKGITFATYINSDISFEEKEKRIRGLKTSEFSILYIAPEYLLSTNIESIIGNRPLGLLVIDEAHIVATWGKEFRVDYWYLGAYIKALKLSGRRFSTLCLTATAVYGNQDDMISEILKSLNLSNTLIYIGNVRRNNIEFDIQRVKREELSLGHDAYKINVTIQRIQEFIRNNQKAIVYCPFKTLIKKIYHLIPIAYKHKVGLYYSDLDETVRLNSVSDFVQNKITVMICTTAFGMGVDINGIEVIYHTAPTGGLTDYVQQVGRAARDQTTKGIAKIDYTEKDMRYIRTLHSISGIKQYQAREILRKILSLYNEKKSRNLLISPETFSYLFDEDEIENKVKCSLLLISKDLEEKYSSEILRVQPKSMFTTNYVVVPSDAELEFLNKYNGFIEKLEDKTKRIQIVNSYKTSNLTITNIGPIYMVKMAEIWEHKFTHLSFGEFKRQFFNGTLLSQKDDVKIAPRLCLTIRYIVANNKIIEKVVEISKQLTSILSAFYSKDRIFTVDDFKYKVKQYFKTGDREESLSSRLLDLFTDKFDANKSFENKDKLKFLSIKHEADGGGRQYQIVNKNYLGLARNMQAYAEQCLPNSSKDTCILFIPANKRSSLIHFSILLEIFQIANCEIVGGKNTEIFVRINDPVKLRYQLEQKYTNKLITKIEGQKRESEKTIQMFLSSRLSDLQRWDYIENYFLGRSSLEDLEEEVKC